MISDFYKEDGSVDDEAYKEAMNNYEYDLYLYDRSVAELNAKASIIQNEIRNKKLDDSQAQRKLELIEKNIKTVQDIQRQLDSLENTPENQAQIAELKQRLEIAEENIKSQIDIQSKIDTLSNQIITKEAPTPPSTSDYLKEDGTVDSEAYSKAYEAYKKACADYDKEQERLNEEMQALFKELNKLIYQMNMLANGQKPRRIPLVARNFEIKQLNLQYMNLLYRN